jgi:signal transduction histidine kinase
MTRQTVIILSSDASFSREVIAKWPQESAGSKAPEFISLDHTLARDLNVVHYDLAIADFCGKSDPENSCSSEHRVSDKKTIPTKLDNIEQSIVASGKPALIIHANSAADFYAIKGAIIELRREPQVWAETLGLIGREILRRRQAESRSREADNIASAAHADAILGRYMLDMGVDINNALTTLLGNAELISQESGLPASVHVQADALRTMALRLNGIFQRFASLNKELAVTVRNSVAKSVAASPSVH